MAWPPSTYGYLAQRLLPSDARHCWRIECAQRADRMCEESGFSSIAFHLLQHCTQGPGIPIRGWLAALRERRRTHFYTAWMSEVYCMRHFIDHSSAHRFTAEQARSPQHPARSRLRSLSDGSVAHRTQLIRIRDFILQRGCSCTSVYCILLYGSVL